MPITSNTKINTDFLNSTSFVVVVDKFQGIAFFTDEVNLPGVNLSHPLQANSFADIHRVGDRIQYDSLALSFRVNEDLSNWEEIYNWMVGASFPEDYKQYRDAVGPEGKESALFTDITITLLDNYKKPLKNITFHSCIPSGLTGFTMSTNDSTIETVTASVTFQFTNFTISPII
jgi:hypothetical protein